MNRRDLRNRLAAVLALLTLMLGPGCERPALRPSTADELDPGASLRAEGASVEFLDNVESNRQDDGSLSDLEFVDTNGQRVQIRQFHGKKNLVLVFTRGFSGELCPYCTTQTSRLIANYDKFRERDAEVLLVYPGTKEQLPQFQQAGLAIAGEDRFPFPVLLDEDLVAVKKLGIVAQLASPSTFILDREGKVRLSYVGSNPADRPSIQAMLDHLDRIRDEG